MKAFKKTIHFIQKIDDVIYKFFDDVNNDTLYLFDLEKVESEYRRVKELYRNHPDHFDLNDFASNYAFSFYQNNDILDHQQDADTMTKQIVNYIQSLKD